MSWTGRQKLNAAGHFICPQFNEGLYTRLALETSDRPTDQIMRSNTTKTIPASKEKMV